MISKRTGSRRIRGAVQRAAARTTNSSDASRAHTADAAWSGGAPDRARVANMPLLDYKLGVLEYVTSSLFESPAQTLVNAVNTVGVMGKGIAKDFRDLYPEMFESYRRFCTDRRFAVGQLYLHRTPHKWVLNFPTKQHWRSPSRLEWIEAGLQKFLESYSKYGITSVAFPQLGTGNGGLDWNQVRPLMERYLKQARIPVYIHVRPRDPKFVPEHFTAGQLRNLKEDLHAARADVTFEQFVNDVRRVFQAELKKPQDPEELPGIELPVAGRGTLSVPGEQMLDFWHTLKLRGAIELAEMPHALQGQEVGFSEKLMTLDYIKPMSFGGERRPGLRYAPPSSSQASPAIDVNPE